MAGGDGQRCDRPGCTGPGEYQHVDGGPGRWCAVHGGHVDESPAHAYAWELARARRRPTWWLQWRERRFARVRHPPPVAMARWAAVRDALRERGVEPPVD